jgi:hypothetical protein
VYCGADLTAETLTVDHVIPQSRGGSNDRYNKAPACGPCNQEKGSLTAVEYLAVRHNKGELKAMKREVSRLLPPGQAVIYEAMEVTAAEFEVYVAREKVEWAREQDRRAESVRSAEHRRARAKAEGRPAGT